MNFATDFRVTQYGRFKWKFDHPNDSKAHDGDIASLHTDRALVVYLDGHCGEMVKADFEKVDTSSGKSNASWKHGIRVPSARVAAAELQANESPGGHARRLNGK